MVIVYLATDFPAENRPLAYPITNFIPTVVPHIKYVHMTSLIIEM